MGKSTPRFAKSNFSDSVPELWTPSHSSCADGFRCARSEFKSHFTKRVPRDSISRVGKCWVITDSNNLVGYITLLTDKLELPGGKAAQKLLKSEGIKYTSFPAIKIGILATDKRTKGAGSAMIDWAINHVAREIAPNVGVRFITVDALYDDASAPAYDISLFYQKFGFQYADPEQKLPPKNGIRTMYFDIKEIIDVLD